MPDKPVKFKESSQRLHDFSEESSSSPANILNSLLKENSKLSTIRRLKQFPKEHSEKTLSSLQNQKTKLSALKSVQELPKESLSSSDILNWPQESPLISSESHLISSANPSISSECPLISLESPSILSESPLLLSESSSTLSPRNCKRPRCN